MSESFGVTIELKANNQQLKRTDSKSQFVINNKNQSGIWRLIELSRPEWLHIAFGLVGSIAYGAVKSSVSILFSKITRIFTMCDKSDQEVQIKEFCWIFFAFGLAAFLVSIFQVKLEVLVFNSFTSRTLIE